MIARRHNAESLGKLDIPVARLPGMAWTKVPGLAQKGPVADKRSRDSVVVAAQGGAVRKEGDAGAFGQPVNGSQSKSIYAAHFAALGF